MPIKPFPFHLYNINEHENDQLGIAQKYVILGKKSTRAPEVSMLMQQLELCYFTRPQHVSQQSLQISPAAEVCKYLPLAELQFLVGLLNGRTSTSAFQADRSSTARMSAAMLHPPVPPALAPLIMPSMVCSLALVYWEEDSTTTGSPNQSPMPQRPNARPCPPPPLP